MEIVEQRLMALLASDNWSADDRKWLLNYLEENDTATLQQIMKLQFAADVKDNTSFNEASAKALLTKIHKELKIATVEELPKQIITKKINRWWYVAAAAVLFFGVFTISSIVEKQPAEPTIVVKPTTKQDIAPGGNNAILTLSDGSIIVLDNAENGSLASQGNTQIIKIDGKLTYTNSGQTNDIVYNTISTPRGGQYKIELADGTMVWLNSASSLQYPTNFVGNERKVILTGEGYFEVKRNESMPFKVNVANKGEVLVLGTQFNINAYSDEATINTTLIEGKVQIESISNKNTQTILPGQQAMLNVQGQFKVNNKPNIEEVLAWKNGKFYFGDAMDIATIMRQISRWYNIDVTYNGKISQHIGGSISRDVPVSKVLNMLEMTGSLKFDVQGKNVIVTAR